MRIRVHLVSKPMARNSKVPLRRDPPYVKDRLQEDDDDDDDDGPEHLHIAVTAFALSFLNPEQLDPIDSRQKI